MYFVLKWSPKALTRLAAVELSQLKPQLDEHNVRLIGIGVDEVGVEEFVKGKFFSGELYIDIGKKCYKAMQYKRFNILNIWPAIFDQRARKVIHKAREVKVGGDFKGDGFQNGGTLVVNAGGEKCLLSYVQDSPAEHIDVNKVLEALEIFASLNSSAPFSAVTDVECNAEACQRN